MQITKPRTFDIPDNHWRRVWTDVYTAFKRNISYGHTVDGQDQNIDGKMVEIANTGAANTQVAITHNLGRVPNFIDFKYKNIACDVYDAGTAWTKTQVFVKFNQANAHVRLFIH